MKNRTLTVISLAISSLALGCNKPTPPAAPQAEGGGAAVVNILGIAQGMGWESMINKNLEESDEKVKKIVIEKILTPDKNTVDAKREEILKTLDPSKKDAFAKANTKEEFKALGVTEKQIEEFGQAVARFNADEESVKRGLAQAHEVQSQKILAEVVKVVRPALQHVAKLQGRNIVLAPQAAVYFNPTADITQDVVDELGKNPGVKPEMPALPEPDLKIAPQPTAAPAPAGTPTTPAPTTPKKPAAPAPAPATSKPAAE